MKSNSSSRRHFVKTSATAMGEAAGTAAALALKNNTEVAEFDGLKVRKTLTSRGARPFTKI